MKFRHFESYEKLLTAIVFGAMCVASVIVLLRHGLTTHWFCILTGGVTAALSISYVGDIEKIEHGE